MGIQGGTGEGGTWGNMGRIVKGGRGMGDRGREEVGGTLCAHTTQKHPHTHTTPHTTPHHTTHTYVRTY